MAGERAVRPGGEIHAKPAAPLDPATDPFAEGHEDQTPPELSAVRPGGGPPNTGGWLVRVVPNLYPALSPDAVPPERQANPDLFWAGPAVGAHEVIVNAPDPVTSLRGPDGGSGVNRDGGVARADARAPEAACRHLIVNERAEAGRIAPAHPRAALRARLRSRHDRARARALWRVRDAHDGWEPARRPRPGGGATPGADRGNRRRSGIDGALRGALPVSAHACPSHTTDALRRCGPSGCGDAAWRARAAARGGLVCAAAEPVGPHRAEWRRAFLLARRHVCPG